MRLSEQSGKREGGVNRTAIGKKGEALARKYLEKKGFRPIDRNFRCVYGEIDIIMRRDKAWRFVEVKFRRTSEYGVPQESVVRRKQARIRNAALLWLKRRHLPLDSEIHFDVLALSKEAGKIQYDYIEDAF